MTNKTPILIERAKVGDFLSIAALDRIAWQDAPFGDVIPDGEHTWRIWCEHALTYVARAATGELAGVALAFPGIDSLYCLHKAMVHPLFRGCGVGSALFSELLKALDARKASCFLTVAPGNEAALTLYKKWGFSDELFVPGYYRPAEDRLVLTRPACPSPDQAL